MSGLWCDSEKDSEVINPLGHKFGDWEVIKKQHRQKKVLPRRACVACGVEEEKELEKLHVDVDKCKLQKYYYE